MHRANSALARAEFVGLAQSRFESQFLDEIQVLAKMARGNDI
jgi:hypothetical protein